MNDGSACLIVTSLWSAILDKIDTSIVDVNITVVDVNVLIVAVDVWIGNADVELSRRFNLERLYSYFQI